MDNLIKNSVNLVEKSRDLAIQWHDIDCNQKYDGKPYSEHLTMVCSAAILFMQQYRDLIPREQVPNVISACWLHDSIEDARVTYNDVKKETNETVAEIVYALTNEKGKNRSERANDKYYEGIKNTPYAVFVKLCDRIANVHYSLKKESSMFNKYVKENDNFVSKLYDEKYKEIFDYLNEICQSNK